MSKTYCKTFGVWFNGGLSLQENLVSHMFKLAYSENNTFSKVNALSPVGGLSAQFFTTNLRKTMVDFV